MHYTKVSQHEFPRYREESFWIGDPNNSYCKFIAPIGAQAYCTESFMNFNKGTLYEITNNNSDFGWITLRSQEDIVEMPYYMFARYFDAECFMRHTSSKPTQELETFES
jgi:hypothetical protein